MFKPLYGEEQHRYHVLSDQARNRYQQKGLREALLCDRCEQRFSVHERYVSQLMFGDAALPHEPDGSTLVVRGVDCKALRLFQLSILWRASVSRAAFFKVVSLGADHEARLRTMLLADDPGELWQYGCMMVVIFHEKLVVQDLIYHPIRTRVQGLPCYRFIFGGMAWVYFVASHRSALGLETSSVDGSDRLRLFKKNLIDIKDIAHFSRSLFEQGKV